MMKQLLLRIPVFLIATAALLAPVRSQESKNKNPEVETIPVSIDEGVAKLSPANTRIEFIGTHVGDDPKPRLGGFEEFEGEIRVEGNRVTSIEVKIKIDSIWTEFDGLTKHLKNADFFEADKFAESSFKSTSCSVNDKGLNIATGDLTLHGTTNEISFPFKAKVDESGLTLKSKFKLDRTQFGMDKMTSGVEETVSIQVVVGQKTQPRKSSPGSGSGKKKKESTATDSPNSSSFH